MTKITGKKRNPQDATRRNVQAVNKRLLGLEKRIEQLERVIKQRHP